MSESQESSKKARGGSRVTDKDLSSLRRDVSAHARNRHFLVGFIQLDGKPESLQNPSKNARVIREEGIVQTCCPLCKGGNQQGAVREGLGTGDADGGVESVVEADDLHGVISKS